MDTKRSTDARLSNILPDEKGIQFFCASIAVSFPTTVRTSIGWCPFLRSWLFENPILTWSSTNRKATTGSALPKGRRDTHRREARNSSMPAVIGFSERLVFNPDGLGGLSNTLRIHLGKLGIYTSGCEETSVIIPVLLQQRWINTSIFENETRGLLVESGFA